MDNKDDPLRSADIVGPADISAAFWAKHGKRIRIVAVIIIALFVLLVIAFNVLSYMSFDPANSEAGHIVEAVSGPSSTLNDGIFGVILNVILPILLVLAAVAYSKFAVNKSAQFMKQVADTLGFSYGESGDASTVSGSLFSFGHDRLLTHVMTGTYQGIPMRIYAYHVSVGNNKSEEEYVFTVCEFTYPYHLPPIILNCKSGETLGIGLEPLYVPMQKDSVTVSLEGDFNKFFSVTTKKGLEREALEIFTPDIMAMLIDQKERIHFESFDSRLYIYRIGFIAGKEAMSQFYENATTLGAKLAPHFKQVSDDVGTSYPSV